MKTKRFKVSNLRKIQFSSVHCFKIFKYKSLLIPSFSQWYLPLFQFDVASLVPLELFYFKTGINPLLRLPRLLKVRFIITTVTSVTVSI